MSWDGLLRLFVHQKSSAYKTARGGGAPPVRAGLCLSTTSNKTVRGWSRPGALRRPSDRQTDADNLQCGRIRRRDRLNYARRRRVAEIELRLQRRCNDLASVRVTELLRLFSPKRTVWVFLKTVTFTVAIISPNVDQFYWFFHCWIQKWTAD